MELSKMGAVTQVINQGQEDSQADQVPIKGLSELEYIERSRYIYLKG
ncbi:hypothetical protein [Arachidicoccus terrestris]|nr:hypothetical protein [Arachidicoccus terrestris]UAY53930.1 hypothetical protein K9M52_10610 [Arachidicoccus terrestris]